ncbi:MAG: hypothetical protein V4520_02510 [Bacteroidota bacterium]
MASKRPPNPNTAYGRKRQREEYYQRKALMTPEERANQNSNEVLIYVIAVIIFGGIAFAIGGSTGLLKWLSH